MFWDIYFASLLFIISLLVGSFLNVCIYRIPLKQSIAKGASHCTSCDTKIKRYDLIPIFSYLLLRGKCRHCKASISTRYPLIELLNCLLYIVVYIQFGLSLHTVLLCALSSALIVVSLIDLDTGEIPDGLQIFIAIISIGAFFISDGVLWWERLIGFLAASLILFVLTLFTNGFGGGDIKLMAVCGLFLGYKAILLALLIGVIIGGITGVIAIIKKSGKSIPFGPQLCIGVFTSALFGNQIIDWYIALITG